MLFPENLVTGADPEFFLRGGALVSCSTSTPINHIIFLQNTSCIRKPAGHLGGGGGGAHPLHPPPRSAPGWGKHWALGNKINCFREETSLLSGLLCSWKFWSWQRLLVITFVGNSALLPCDIIDFAIFPAQRFWQETVSLLDVMWPRSNQRDHGLLVNNFQLYNKRW